jgi:hypothetical protein
MSRLAFGGQGKSGIESKYTFVPLPITEAEADGATYVCEFTGAAGANEVGVGGGLTGADLVLTQHGSVGASVGGYRRIVKDTNQAFSLPIGLVNAFAQHPAGFSVLWRLKDLDVSVLTGNRNYLFEVQAANYGEAGVNLLGLQVVSNNRRSMTLRSGVANSTDTMGASFGNIDALSSDPPSPDFMILYSLDYATKTAFIGLTIGTVQPTSFSDCFYFAFNRGDSVFGGAGATTAWNYSRNTIIGCIDTNYPNSDVGVEIGSVTFAKYPALVPA